MRGHEQPRRAGHSSAGQSRGEVERAAKGRVDGQRRRPMALPAARVVSRQGDSGPSASGRGRLREICSRRARGEEGSPVFVGHVAVRDWAQRRFDRKQSSETCAPLSD